MIVLSVSQTYWNRGVRRHRRSTKKIWQVYYLDEDAKLHTMRVNWAQAIYYKTQIKRRRKAFCPECNEEFVGFFKNDKEILKTKCPYCADDDIALLPADSVEQFQRVLRGLQE